jgi:SAM-dependent methyltransferase
MPADMRAIARRVLPTSVRRFIHNARETLGQAVNLDRKFIAKKFLRGEGIEIGALHMPLEVPPSAKVRYVDRLTPDELTKHYPELSGFPLVKPDIIDDGQTLAKVADESQDFVIANHFVEHAPDPLGTIANMLRVLKNGGVLYLALPDKRFTFDADRPITPLEHIIRDHVESPDWSHLSHYEEWARLIDKKEGEEAERHARELMEMDYSIHFHVWTPIEALEMITFLKKGMGLDFDVELFCQNVGECIFVLRKNG